LRKTIPSRVRVTATVSLADPRRLSESSPDSLPSDPNRHRVHENPPRVRIEVRQESKTTDPSPNNDKEQKHHEGKEKDLDSYSRLSKLNGCEPQPRLQLTCLL
jgi:hypothetical protein